MDLVGESYTHCATNSIIALHYILVLTPRSQPVKASRYKKVTYKRSRGEIHRSHCPQADASGETSRGVEWNTRYRRTRLIRESMRSSQRTIKNLRVKKGFCKLGRAEMTTPSNVHLNQILDHPQENTTSERKA